MRNIVLQIKNKEIVKKTEPAVVGKPFDVKKFLQEDFTNSETALPLNAENLYIRASKIYYWCPREEVLKSKFNLTTVGNSTPRDAIIFGLGSKIHEWFQNDIFKKHISGAWKCRDCKTELGNVRDHIYCPPYCPNCKGKNLEYLELTLSMPELCLGGHTDGFAKHYDQDVVIDFKSASMESFQGLDRWGISDGYKWQQNAYMLMSNRNLAILVYFNKNNDEFRQIFIERDESIIEKIIEKCKHTIKGIYSLEGPMTWMPPRKCCENKSCARAKACPVKNECFNLSADAVEMYK